MINGGQTKWTNTSFISLNFKFDILINPNNAFSEILVLKVMTQDGIPLLMPMNITVW